MGVEACFWGKLSILIGKAFYEDLDCCYIPKTHQELFELLCFDLDLKDKNNSLKYGYWRVRHKIPLKKFAPLGLGHSPGNDRFRRNHLPSLVANQIFSSQKFKKKSL